MPRFHVSASYQTPSGGMSWADHIFTVADTDAAFQAMRKRLGKRAARALDMKVVRLKDIPA